MKKKIILFGGGGQFRVTLDCIERCLDYSVVAVVLPECPEPPEFHGIQVVSQASFAERNLPDRGIVCIGDNSIRERVTMDIVSEIADFRFESLIHPSAALSPSAVVGAGSIVLAGAVVGPDSRIGEHCIVNSGAIVEHDCTIKSFSHVAPGTVMGGGVSVGERSLLGLGCRILPGMSIGNDTIIGAGSVVIRHIPQNCVAAGVPVRLQSKIK